VQNYPKNFAQNSAGLNLDHRIFIRYGTLLNNVPYRANFALKNLQASCQFNLAHELKEN